MYPEGKVFCPKCKEEMNLRVGRSWYNEVYFYCSCGERLEV